MIVTIHQPNFFPWLGYFDKMVKADVFILLDNVQFTKGGYQNRALIKTPNGSSWMTTPVITKGRMGQSTMDVEINNTMDWPKEHLRTLEVAYRKAPHYDRLADGLASIYGHQDSKLVDICIRGIEWSVQELGIETKLIRASELGPEGSSSQLLLDLVTAVGGNEYLSGPSGRNYLDTAIFDEANVKLSYHEFQAFPYPQLFGEFIPRLSALDYLFNAGDAKWWTGKE